MSADLSTRIHLKGTSDELLSMLRTLRSFNRGKMCSLGSIRASYRSDDRNKKYISDIDMKNSELLEFVSESKNEIYVEARGPYGCFDMGKIIIFEALADSAPNAYFDGRITGFITGADVGYTATLSDGKMKTSYYEMPDDYLPAYDLDEDDDEYDKAEEELYYKLCEEKRQEYIEKFTEKTIYDPVTYTTIQLTNVNRRVERERPEFIVENGKLLRYTGKSSDVIIPDDVTEIDSGAFYNCKLIRSVVIPNSVTKISSEAFRGCINLKSITIPEGLMDIGEFVFAGCAGLQDEKGFFIANDILYKYFGEEKKVIIPPNVKRIAPYAFAHNYEINSVTLPEGMTQIESGAFDNCFISDIIIPDSVTQIDYSTVRNRRIHAHEGSFAMEFAKSNKRVRCKVIK